MVISLPIQVALKDLVFHCAFPKCRAVSNAGSILDLIKDSAKPVGGLADHKI
jgi:hypothetical protein